MRRLGTIVRIQIQVDRLKAGEEPRRFFDPAPIRRVDRVWVSPEGLVAPTEAGFLLDVHHRAHPHSRNREGANALSFGFTSHYARMRDRFGARLSLGIAGENLIVDRAEPVAPSELAGGALIRAAGGGELRLGSVIPAPPCAPFASWALGSPEGVPDPRARKEALGALGDGTRGYYATVGAPGPFLVSEGDELWALD